MEKTTLHKKKQFVPNAFKFMVAVSSVAGTFGVWNLLANKDLIQVNAQNSTSIEPTVITDLQPLPTLVPLISVDLTAVIKTSSEPSVSPTATTLRNVAPPAPAAVTNNQNTPAIIMDSQNASGGAPAPVTNTKSSRP